MVKNLVFGSNYFACGEFVLYINHSGKYIEIDFNMKIPFFIEWYLATFKPATPFHQLLQVGSYVSCPPAMEHAVVAS